RSSDTGRTIVDVSVARDALADALGERDEFLSTSISAYSVKRAPMLKVSATCRRGVSPRDATAIVEQNLEALDALLGQKVPVLLQLSGGFRAKVQQSTRLQ
ncbi:hypothetical protein C5C19_00665, partial [Pseudoclavibacter sp. RFBH5]